MVANPALLADVAADLTAWEVAREEHPLAFVRLWHREGVGEYEVGPLAGQARPRTSQRAAVARMLETRTGYTEGGTRSGKTYSKLCAMTALALGSDHPAARAFWLGNGMDPDHFPKGPAHGTRGAEAGKLNGEVWIVAVTSGASLEYHREPVEALLTPGTYTWSNRDGRGPAKLSIRCPGYTYPAVIRFKSEDQKRRGMQGARCRGILNDEEGKTPDVWDECNSRCVDANGWHWMTNTPVDGITWVQGRLVEKTSEDAEHDCLVYRIHSVDNPHLDDDGRDKLRKGSVQLRAAKLYGLAQARSGLVWPDWNRAIHERDIPGGVRPEWTRFCGLDFGARHNTCVLWGAMGPDGLLVIYRELYTAGLTTSELARRIGLAEGAIWHDERVLEPGDAVEYEWEHLIETRPDGRRVVLAHFDWRPAERVEIRWGDPSAAQTIRDLGMYGILVRPANRDWLTGVSAVEDRLVPASDGQPRVAILPGAAPALCREMAGLAYPDDGVGDRRESPPPRPIGGDDATDAFRYLCMGVRYM